jgi:hypothetical protein
VAAETAQVRDMLELRELQTPEAVVEVVVT